MTCCKALTDICEDAERPYEDTYFFSVRPRPGVNSDGIGCIGAAADNYPESSVSSQCLVYCRYADYQYTTGRYRLNNNNEQ